MDATTELKLQQQHSGTSVLIFVPSYKSVLTSVVFEATHALHSVLRDKGIGVGVATISVPDIDWVRNFAITLWYDKFPDATHLLFVDDDMGFPPNVVLDMLEFDEPVVGAIYPKKKMEREWAVSSIENPEIRGNFIELEGIGGGCLLIRRDCVTTMLEKMPHLADSREKVLWGFAQTNGLTRMIRAFDRIFQDDGGIISEDIAFGRRWRECGGKVWGAAHHAIIHCGPFYYTDSYARWASEQMASGNAKLKPVDGIPAEAIETMPCKHGTFSFLRADNFVGQSLREYGEWTEFEVDVFRQLDLEGKTVLDVGANIGAHTVPLAKMVGPNGKVIAMEPQPVFLSLLERNVQQNALGNVIIGNMAAGDKDGTIEVAGLPNLNEARPFNFGGVALSDGNKWGAPTQGQVITIDSMNLQECALIKIDAEGMDVAVLRGAIETIKRCKPFIFVEANGDCRELANVIGDIGYYAYWAVGEYAPRINFRNNNKNAWDVTHPNLIPSANLILMPKPDAFFANHREPFGGAGDTWMRATRSPVGGRRAI